MIVSRSKIKADRKLTVFDTDSTIINVYQFPDIFLDAFFDAVNGQAYQPMGDWVVEGWDPIQKNWGSMQAHDFNVENRWDSDPLNFSGTTISDIKRIVVHDIGAVNTPAGTEWNILCHYEFTPPLRPAPGASIKLGHRVKRFMSRLPETRLEEYQWDK